MFLKNYKLSYLKKDIPAGIIVALVSIPISIGYALVSGLPPVYGLYGSVLPILVFGLLSSSPRFVFGVDAAPAALVGGMIYSLGMQFQSEQAIRAVPVITLFTAAWLLLFWILKAGRFVKFISTPVMGGFITGICCTIILMQIPKLFGGDAGRGELGELLPHIVKELQGGVSWLSLGLGLGTIVIISVCRKLIPKVPMSAVMMFAGAGAQLIFGLDRYGVKLLPDVHGGLPAIRIPDITVFGSSTGHVFLSSFTIALVILAETLLSTNSYALRYDDKVDNNREILSYAAGNIAAALVGCCPVNGSVSRTGIVDQFGVRSQMMSVVASASMVLILLFGTGFISLLPVPVLTGIVISALMGILEFDLARELHKVDRTEWIIFYIVFFVVLIFGTVWGVLAGIMLSFITVIIRESAPPTEELGCIPGRDRFYPLGRNRNARPIKGVFMYRFRSPLFFANVGTFQEDIENGIQEGINTVIVDASGISSIDVTAAERLLILYDKFKERGIKFYLTKHSGTVNDQLRTYGAERMIMDGACRPTIKQALRSSGRIEPYELDSGRCGEAENDSIIESVKEERLAEFEWAFGSDADAKMKELAGDLARKLMDEKSAISAEEAVRREESAVKRWSGFDEEAFLDMLEMQLAAISKRRNIRTDRLKAVEKYILEHHAQLDEMLSSENEEALEEMISKRVAREREFKRKYPEVYGTFQREREKHRDLIREKHPELLDKIDEMRRAAEEGNGLKDQKTTAEVYDREKAEHTNEPEEQRTYR